LSSADWERDYNQEENRAGVYNSGWFDGRDFHPYTQKSKPRRMINELLGSIFTFVQRFSG